MATQNSPPKYATDWLRENGLAVGTKVRVTIAGVYQYLGTVVGYHRGCYVVQHIATKTVTHYPPSEITEIK